MLATVTGLLAQRPFQTLSPNPSPVTNILAQFACNAGLMKVMVLLEAAVKLLALLRLNQTDNDTVKKAGFGGCFCDGHDFGIMGVNN
jgi:hypothetical protein